MLTSIVFVHLACLAIFLELADGTIALDRR